MIIVSTHCQMLGGEAWFMIHSYTKEFLKFLNEIDIFDVYIDIFDVYIDIIDGLVFKI